MQRFGCFFYVGVYFVKFISAETFICCLCCFENVLGNINLCALCPHCGHIAADGLSFRGDTLSSRRRASQASWLVASKYTVSMHCLDESSSHSLLCPNVGQTRESLLPMFGPLAPNICEGSLAFRAWCIGSLLWRLASVTTTCRTRRWLVRGGIQCVHGRCLSRLCG